MLTIEMPMTARFARSRVVQPSKARAAGRWNYVPMSFRSLATTIALYVIPLPCRLRIISIEFKNRTANFLARAVAAM